MATSNTSETNEIVIRKPQTQSIRVRVIGTSPLILNAMSAKAKQELLIPRKKTTADRANGLKHIPLNEYRASPYKFENDEAPTLIGIMAGGFKQGMGLAAMRLGGAKRTEIEQMVVVPEYLASVWGVPQLFMSVTRSADMNKTPDVRTRAIVHEWCAEFTIMWIANSLNESSLLNLLEGAGLVAGIGDWRQEKGSGSFGAYTIVDADNLATFERIKRDGGRAAQIAALENPVPYDNDTRELLAHFDAEVKRRGEGAQTPPKAATADTPPAAPRGRKAKANGHDTAGTPAH